MLSRIEVVGGTTLAICLASAETAWAADPRSFSAWTYFQDGGWGMWWLLALGAVSFLAALRFAWRGEHQLVPFLKWMIATELLVGAFSFLSGMTLVLRYVTERAAPDERWWILFIGTREALSNLTFALLWSAMTALAIAVGNRRFPELNPGALVGTHE